MVRKISLSVLCFLGIAAAALLPVFAEDARRGRAPGPAPVLVGLEVSAPRDVLLVGESLQLRVEGTYADGSRVDLAGRAETLYSVMNGEALAVERGGVVHGMSPGDGVVLVVHQTTEGAAMAHLALAVRAPGDRDGDGLPDGYEIQHQLNPDFASDAELDPDADALANLGELAAGTDPRRADTDGDFAPDGLEVALGTDPLVPEGGVAGESPLLDDSCVVSALNRSARVQANGVWVLPNVPANAGRVRVRATCVENGVTRSGQSDFFTVPANGTIEVAEIRFDDPAAVPAELSLAAPQTLLTAAGQTVQITAAVSLPDGSTVDVTPAAAGTGYLSSNPAIASVSAGGLVTAQVSGTALVSALNEGALGLLRFRVVLSGDSDGDGLPDDFELANGLDPNNPFDVLDDHDADGLSTGDEFPMGLDPFDPDTDNDRLLDGREGEVGTNPLLFDTDGDRVSDGLEVEAGSDPLDPDSADLGPILESLTVSPASFTLIFNTVLGEASRRLDVTARLIDGTEIAARSRRYGTGYLSSDLTVASFGAEDGVVFAGQDGTATITVQIGSQADTTLVLVESFSPTALSYLPLAGFPNGVAVSGDFAYVTADAAGLHVVDVSNLAAPVRVGTVDTPGNANDVRVQGGYAYVADGSRGLQVIDIGDPANPRIVGTRDTPGDATDLAVRGDRAYVADGLAGLQIVDVTLRTAPVLLGRVDTPGRARGVDLAEDGLAVVADSGGGVHVVGIANPSAPVILGSTHTRVSWSHAADVAVRGRRAWVADGADGDLGGLRVVDFTNPGTPVVTGGTSDAFGLVSVALDGGLAATADYYFVNAVPLFDIAAAPVFSAVLDFSGAPGFRDDNGNGVAIRPDGAVFLVATRSIADNGAQGNGGLHIGRYRQGGDDLGVPPEVALTAPAAGVSARERSSLTVRAQATDDIRVESVAFLVDGTEVARDLRAPFEASVQVPEGAASIRLGAVARDLGENEAAAEEVTVAVTPDDDPVVTLLAPVAGARLREATEAEVVALATDDVQVELVEVYLDGELWAAFDQPPYRMSFLVPLGASQMLIEVRATDGAGQTASVSVTVPVEDDPSPVVAVVAPSAGTELVEGAPLAVSVGAVDDQGISFVELTANGAPVATDSVAPYDFALQVPAGVSELRLRALAEDAVGQQTAVEHVLSVIPDPLTTAAGRVVDAQGQPVAGATVRCLAAAGTSGADGTFSVPGLPTVLGRIACGASAVTPGGAVSGGSAPVPPVPAGTTEVGDVVVQGHLLYLGSGGYGSFEPGRLLVRDETAGRLLSWSHPIPPYGLSGLAVDGEGRLFATTVAEDPPQSATSSARKARKARAIEDSEGRFLLRLDPDTGSVLERFGPFSTESGDVPSRLQDLVFDPLSSRFYALGGGFNSPPALFRLDPATLAAEVLAADLPYGAGGLALGPDGLLALLATREGLELWQLDPETGALVSTAPIAGTSGSIRSMVLQPGTRRFLLAGVADLPGEGFGEAGLLELDLATLQLQPLPPLDGTVAGNLEGLAFRPLGAAATVTTVRGRIEDADGLPVEGAEVLLLGGAGLTGADGRFEIVDVPVRTPLVRIAVRAGGEEHLPPGVPPGGGGITDLGTIVLGGPACVTGKLLAPFCADGPVTTPLGLYEEDDQGQLVLLGQVTPDAEGRFCAVLRRNRIHYMQREDFTCTCGGPAFCGTFPLVLDDPAAVGTSCGGDLSGCQDLGTIELACDLFCEGP